MKARHVVRRVVYLLLACLAAPLLAYRMGMPSAAAGLLGFALGALSQLAAMLVNDSEGTP